jgi:hypothetical protein
VNDSIHQKDILFNPYNIENRAVKPLNPAGIDFLGEPRAPPIRPEGYK